MFRKKILMFAVLLSCTIGCMQKAKAVEGPFIFDWQVRNFIRPGFEEITPIPNPAHDYEADHWYYTNLYTEMYAANRAIGLMLQQDANPIDGNADWGQGLYALSTVMGYAPRLDFVWADFEDSNRDAETLEMVRQVRSNSNPDINSAYISNYNDYPGTIDTSERWPGMSDRTARDTFYRTSGLNIANPACYPYEYYSIHTWSSQWGTNISPNKRSALFWAPLEKFSVAKRNLPAGHLLIPWVGRFVEIEGEEYDAPIPTREDVRALIQHMRLRGADGYYRLSGILSSNVTGDPNENIENMWDFLKAWQVLDKVFEGSGAVSILNLNTNKTGGVEWSGVQHGSVIAIIVSNLSNSDVNIALPSGYGLPATFGNVAPGEHKLRIYETIVPAADVCVKNNGKITNALYTSWFGDSDSAGPYNYLKFDITSMTPSLGYKTVIKSLTLKTYAPAVSGVLGSYTDALYGIGDDSWSEPNISWANKPAIGSQLASWTTPTVAGWLNINASSLASFVEQQANDDGIVSFAIHDLNATRTNQQYQHYYDKSESSANCFQLVAVYEPLLTALPLKTVTLTPIDWVKIAEWPSMKFRMQFQTSYWYGDVMNYVKYDLSQLVPPLKYKTVVTSVSNINGWMTGSMTGDVYSDAFYEAADTWDYNSITWPTRPLPGAQLVSWLFPDIYQNIWTIPSTNAWKTYVQNEANGDGIMSLCLQDLDASGTESQNHMYNVGPNLTITYQFELSEAPTSCEEAKAQHYKLVHDLNGDCYVNFEDFAIVAEEWLL